MKINKELPKTGIALQLLQGYMRRSCRQVETRSKKEGKDKILKTFSAHTDQTWETKHRGQKYRNNP